MQKLFYLHKYIDFLNTNLVISHFFHSKELQSPPYGHKKYLHGKQYDDYLPIN